jgi:hypothetical protein
MADNKPQGVQMEEVMVAISTLIKQMNEDNREAFLSYIKEVKKPSDLDQRKLDLEATKERRRIEESIDQARIEIERRENVKRSCSHTMYHPGTGVERHLWRGQVHAPANEKPYFIPTCTKCRTQLPKILATPEMLTNGVNLDQYIHLNVETLERWAKQAEVA